MTENKTQPTNQPVADFLAGIAEPQRRAACQRAGNDEAGDWPTIGFSPRKNDLTLEALMDEPVKAMAPQRVG